MVATPTEYNSGFQSLRYIFGAYTPPVPMSEPDSVKASAPLTKLVTNDPSTHQDNESVPLPPDQHELLKIYWRCDEPGNVEPGTTFTAHWYDPRGREFFTFSHTAPSLPSGQRYLWYEFYAWVGRTSSNQFGQPEITGPGIHRLSLDVTGSGRHFVLDAEVDVIGDAPPVPPGPTMQHEIRIRYREGLFGVGDKLAQKAALLNGAVASLLPSEYALQEIRADTLNNEVVILIDEYGSNVIQGAVLIAILAVIIAVLALFYLGFTYKENQILKAQVDALETTRQEIGGIVNDDSLSDEEKIRKIIEALNRAPPPLPDDGSPFSDIAELLKFALPAVLILAVIKAVKD